MGFAHLLYILSAVFFFAIAVLFYQTKDGMERKVMMWIFATTSLGLFFRGFTVILPDEVINFYKDLIPVLIVTPISISSGVGFFLLYKKYYKKWQQ